MVGKVLTPVEISLFKNNVGKITPADVEDLIVTVEKVCAERDYYRGLVDEMWDDFCDIK